MFVAWVVLLDFLLFCGIALDGVVCLLGGLFCFCLLYFGLGGFTFWVVF